ncbi:maleylpyruvate isomerase family mycothiol-dependent enzyme [Nocardioides mangrovicus]|uniref:Maleylpyruvate isomerase family mycothiol-dependent enzyme n=1 Tax=Nocardioides mangrovicus TaxID=2478913 RepID=A0A3L8P1B9_9ACTN|nr:maleylpyruvate isomerase family mycothiol-dependent enzyme [Nocardioides mangrovicus]RLV48747.1 maleylpyruvate isomerase family mycothiol-dependent enzyme [Nocardioides mangrovicus]
MTLSTARCLESITHHSRGLAAAADGALRKRVQHAPDWNVADLVWHVTEVHWFWRTITGELLDGPPEDARRPPRAPDDELLDTFLAGADAIVETLRHCDQQARCWTWFPPQQDVAFVTRHQVQEAAVHHWDAANEIGEPFAFAPDIASDSISEFLTTSLADADDAVRIHTRDHTQLGEPLVLHASDTDEWWTVSQDGPEAALLWTSEPGDPTVEASVSDLLLWVYERLDLPTAKGNLVNRFRRMSSTD